MIDGASKTRLARYLGPLTADEWVGFSQPNTPCDHERYGQFVRLLGHDHVIYNSIVNEPGWGPWSWEGARCAWCRKPVVRRPDGRAKLRRK